MENELKDGYQEADEYVVFHEDDPDLKTMVFRLPTPPKKELIAGYGKRTEDQRFEMLQLPPRLKYLEKEALRLLKEENEKRNNFTLTPFKIQRKFWQLFESKAHQYKSEIAFIKRTWWHRMNGYWFYNRGKPTYITGWHFMYLNYWFMGADVKNSRPEYRDRDRKEFLYFHYTYITKETFANLNEKGYGIANEDGTYDMVELKDRISYGGIQSKNRRSGNTNKGFCCCDEIATRTKGMDVALGVMSYTSDNAGSLFRDKLVAAFFDKPLWLAPFTTSYRNTKEVIGLDVGGSEFEYTGLETIMDYAKTANAKYYDGKKMATAMMDEEGKVLETDVAERWRIVKQCLALGNGKMIHGWSYHPSTVEELTSGGAAYKILIEASNFYRRVPTSGQTYSGLMQLFVPADEGLEGYIDSYGYSVKGDEILDYQKEEGFIQTSTQYLKGTRNAFLRDNDTDSYRGEKKLFPLQYSDSWIGDHGSLGFDIEKIDKRLEELNREKLYVSGSFEWVGGIFGSDVVWVEDNENGRFQMAMNAPKGLRNKKVQVEMYSAFKGGITPMYRPTNPNKFVMGVDPFDFSNKQQAESRKKAKRGNSGLSDGGIAIYWAYDDSVDGGKASSKDWASDKFVLSYRHRSSLNEFNEDVLKAAIYYGAMVYPETNKTATYEYLIEKDYGGYLLYDVDVMTGKLKEKPGVFSLSASKNSLFTGLKDYLDRRCDVEAFDAFLTECKEIGGTNEMTDFDRLTAHGIALMGSKSTYSDMFSEDDIYNNSTNLDDYIEQFWD